MIATYIAGSAQSIEKTTKYHIDTIFKIILDFTTPMLYYESMNALKLVNTSDFGIQDFLNNQVSEHTKRAYSRDLKDFSEFLKTQGISISDPNQLTINLFLKFRDHLINAGVASKTLHRKLSALKSLMRWFHLNGYVNTNPLSSLKIPKAVVKSPTQALSDDEVVRVLENCNDLEEKVIFQLLFNLGLRRSELLNIKVSDIVEHRGHTILRVLGKGSKIRELPLPDSILYTLKYYINSNFRTDKVLLLSDSALYRKVKNVFKKAEINKEVSPHSCRATVISHLLDTQQVPIRDVADFAGHVSVDTTSLYDKRRKGLENSPTYKVNYGGKNE